MTQTRSSPPSEETEASSPGVLPRDGDGGTLCATVSVGACIMSHRALVHHARRIGPLRVKV
jgi:hypothetical protein